MARAEILIVEDNRIVAEDLQNCLKDLGFAVCAIISSGEEALDKIKEHKPDLVLMDIMLKGEMDGTEAAGLIRTKFNIPVVYLTAYADEDVLERAKTTEPFGYIIKPFEERELNTAIEIALYKHKMEKRLKESEQWLSTTLRSIGDAVIATDTMGYVTFMNPVSLSLTGWKEEEAIGKPLEDVFNIINEETRGNVENPVTKVIRAGGVIGLANHTLLIAKDGTEIPIGDSGSPIVDEKEDITGVVLVFRDMREKKQVEDALRESKEKYRQLFENEADAILVFDSETSQIEDINRAASVLYGYGKEEFLTLTIEDISAEKEKTRTAVKNIKNRVDGSGQIPLRYHQKKDGSSFPIEINSGTYQSGESTKIIGAVRDISKRIKSEETLRESEETFRAITASAQDAIILMNEKGRVSYWNPAAEKIFGYPSQEIIGEQLHEIIVPERHRQTFGKNFGGFKKSGEGPAIGKLLELDGLKKDKSEFPIELSISGVKLKGEWNTVGIIRDVTERKIAAEEKKALEDQLKQAQKMETIGTLAGGIAHDFNNILGIIVGNTEMAKNDLPEWNPVYHNLKEIFNASLRARDLVKQLLAFSRQSLPELKPIKIGPIIKGCLDLLRSSIPTTIEIRHDISIESDTIHANPTQINQVLMNLCTNAAYAMREEGGILQINLENVELDEESVDHYHQLTPGQYVRFTVSDTGHGMESEVMERIFEPYFTTKKVGEGSGIGLAVVHGIVKTHGGDISVKSEPEKGTTFHVLFPIITGEPVSETEINDEISRGNERILFVDDEKAMVNAIQPMLERLGYKVTARTSSIEALEVFRHRPDEFDLVITDQTMPNMTGIDLSKELQRIRPDVLIILCTGYSEMINKDNVRELGIRALAMKPLVISEMAKTIRKVIHERDK